MSLIGYSGYKQSGTSWLGSVPDHWQIKPLWSMFKRHKRTGHQHERLLSVYRDYGVIPKDSRDDNANKASEDLSTYQLVKPGDLAVNKMKAWQGSVAISNIQGIVSPAYFIFTPAHHSLPKYLHYLFRCARYIAGYLSISKGVRVGQWDMDPDYHSRMPVLIPPREEQEEIVNYLDRETARIDSLIEKKSRFIELLKEKRQGVITNAVTKGIDSSVPMMKTEIEWVGKTPKHWSINKLKWSVKGCFNGVWGDEPNGVNDLIVVRVADFNRHNRTIDLSNHTIRSIESSARTNRVLKKNDLLIEKSGGGDNQPVGMVVIYDSEEPAVCSNFVARMPVAEGFDPYFITYLHQAIYATRLQIKSIKQSTGIQNLDSSSYLDELAPYPPFLEQVAIREFLTAKCRRFDDLLNKTNRSIELLRERRSALITATVTGKIDVRKSK